MSGAENPAAFPSVCLDDPGHPSSVPGMSLRDWFAGQALAGVLTVCAHPKSTGPVNIKPAPYAELAYSIADAMLAERAKATQS